MTMKLRQWSRSGEPWIWLNAAAVSVCVLMVLGLISVIAARGLAHFWPGALIQFEVSSESTKQVVLGQVRESEWVASQRLRESGLYVPPSVDQVQRHLLRVGNRDLVGQDFVWLLDPQVSTQSEPHDAVVIERREWGPLFGFVDSVGGNDPGSATGQIDWPELQALIDRSNELTAEIQGIEANQISAVNQALEQLRLEVRRLEIQGNLTVTARAALEQERQQLQSEYQQLTEQLAELAAQRQGHWINARTANGEVVSVPIEQVLRAYRPNQMSFVDKLQLYGAHLWEFVSDSPREANTEGGVYPAIFGTVIMVILMSVIVTPFGVIAAIYLHEYAGQGRLTRLVRIGVNNLAGVPSIVYGVFGLGLFVYVIGGTIDQLFYPEALPAPTFGTGGLLWASMTLAILTLPVVIVATEEGLSRIPSSIREGSFALGANRAETLRNIVLPMASPAIMTGVILAVARAAGEVAPLMLVGVVKLAPTLPVDASYPFLHLDRKFMHLGFHIYDVGFQSPNVEASRPLVFATALLLLLVILVLNLTAISIRNRLRDRFRTLDA